MNILNSLRRVGPSLQTAAAWLVALTLGAGTIAAFGEPATDKVEFKPDDAKGQMQVLLGGKEVLVYVYGKDVDLPHFFPLRSPSGKSMTVQQTDPYPHHRSFWFADTVQLAGQRQVSFYNGYYSGVGDKKHPLPPYNDHVRHVSFTEQTGGAGKGQLGAKLVWEMDAGKTPVLEEARTMRVVPLGEGEYFLDLSFTLKASYGDVTFRSDAVHYAWPYLRLNDDFNDKGGGLLVNSEGATGQTNTSMKIAQWVDFSRTDVSNAEGLAMFSHPSNEQPHAWLTRDYGCLGPRRVDAKSGKPFTLKQGESISTRCGVLVHRGDVKSGRVAERFQAYAGGRL